MTAPAETHCRVCGLDQGYPPWGDDGETSSFDICSCCGTEAGYEDNSPAAARMNRQRWLATGAQWFCPAERPADWDLQEQLKHIPPAFQ